MRKRIKNVIPYIVMVTGLTAVLTWHKMHTNPEPPIPTVTLGCSNAASPMSVLDPDHQKIILIDVRTPAEFEARHRAGAVNMPFDQVESLAPKLIPDKDTHLLLYCRTGKRADQAMEVLKKMGYKNVQNLHRQEY